jgi:hypothetical protein
MRIPASVRVSGRGLRALSIHEEGALGRTTLSGKPYQEVLPEPRWAGTTALPTQLWGPASLPIVVVGAVEAVFTFHCSWLAMGIP